MSQMDWPQIPLVRITTKIGSGATPRGGKESYKRDGVALIRSLNVYDFQFERNELAHIDNKQAEQLSNVVVQRGDILLNITGASVARCCIVPSSILPARVNQHVAIVRVDETKAHGKFIYYCINSPLYKHHLLSLAQGGATREALTKQAIEDFEVPLPDLSTQRRIASILSAYDDLIENNTRRIAILEEMARRIYEEWFVRFRFPGHEQVKMVESELGLIPEGWRRGSISELYEGLYDGPHATPKPSISGPVFLGIGNLTETGRMDLSSVRHIAEEDFGKWTKRVCPQAGDIVFTYEATLNRYALIPNSFRGCLGRRLALIRANPKTHSNLYLFCMFFSEGWRQVVAQNTLSGATVDRIPLSKFPSFPIMIPSMPILAAFDGIVRPLFAEIEVLGRKNANLRATRDLLLPKLISGELDVSSLPEPEEGITA